MPFPPPPEFTRACAEADAPSLAGDLSHIAPAEVLQLLGYLSLSGVLEFERGDAGNGDRVRFHILRGRVVDAQGSGTRLRLGELLVRRYEVALEAVLDQLRYQSQERERTGQASRLGTRLLAAGQLQPEVLRRALEEAASRLAYGVLSWREGRFAYWSREVSEPEETSPDIGLEALVLERWHAGEETA